MASLLNRLKMFAIEEDSALNGLGGGKRDQTISGTLGRALAAGKPWAPMPVLALNMIVWWLTGDTDHCQNVAADEAREAAELGEAN